QIRIHAFSQHGMQKLLMPRKPLRAAIQVQSSSQAERLISRNCRRREVQPELWVPDCVAEIQCLATESRKEVRFRQDIRSLFPARIPRACVTREYKPVEHLRSGIDER